tara:strand:+ start:42 stop:605 length:564 start_codon:yes stop_codon:yes gene_type:complete
MPIVFDGSAGTVTGISAGGLPAGSVTSATLADGAASGTKLTMPANSIIKIQNYTNAAKSDVTSNSTWTKWDNTEVAFTPTFSNSKLEIMWVYSLMTNGNGNSGIGIQIWKEVGGTDTLLAVQYQYLHFYGDNWDGPGAVTTAYIDTLSSSSATSYYLKGYKEGGGTLSLNYGQDPTGMTCIIKEIKQ